MHAAPAGQDDAIAIVGMGCRFPGGVHDAASYWALLRDGVDAIGEVPRDRWDIDAFFDPDPDAPGNMYTRWGGFLNGPDGVYDFDAPFFGIAPREVLSMDPQQRLLLEVTWEALEDAGTPPARLKGSQTSVFVGMCGIDHGTSRISSLERQSIDAWTSTGSLFSVAAGRISYLLGLNGPCMALDTACSSSLVALHLACQSLRQQESTLALAGGVNLILRPESTISLSRLRALSPDGRCKAFDAGANGYVRADGCGVVVLAIGPVSVSRSIALDLDSLWQTSNVWGAVFYQFPSYRIVGVISSSKAAREHAWHTLDLPPGRYAMALRYYHAGREIWLPAMRVDGRDATPRRRLADDPDAFYRQLAGHGNAFYRALHYYALTMLRYRAALPPDLVHREFVPVGNPETHFRYDLLRAGQVVSLETDEILLRERDLFLTISGRDSFPRFWCQVEQTRFEAPPAPCDGFYLVRIHPRRSGLAPVAADMLTVRIDGRAIRSP